MKKSVYKHSSVGSNGSLEIEVFLDINRELTDNDNYNIREHVEGIVKSIYEESIKLNPKATEQAKTERLSLLGVFGERVIFVDEIPNGYCSDYCCKHLPWFIVTTTKGRIKIGWRKRVINIDWTDSIVKEDAETLFPDEDTTKTNCSIHAWGYEKAKEYIDKILK